MEQTNSRSSQELARQRHRSVRSFVMRRARMNELHRRAIERLSPQYVLSLPRDYDGSSSLFEAFPGDCSTRVLEIGFGMGYATAQFAAANPDVAVLGSEVYPPGIGKLLAEIERLGLENVRIVRHDAVDVLRDGTGPGELHACHIFFPDPWPKKKHHKRRLIQPWFIQLLADRIMPGGYCYITTDWADYAEHIAEVLEHQAQFSNIDPLPDDTRASLPRAWRPRTSFEKKGLAKGHTVSEFYYRRTQVAPELVER